MASQRNQVPIEQVIANMRDNILRTQSQASTVCITSFDSLVEQLKVFVYQVNEKNVEILRLQALCKKNNIDSAIPPIIPKSVKTETLKPTPKA